jgi:hypothetical protein
VHDASSLRRATSGQGSIQPNSNASRMPLSHRCPIRSAKAAKSCTEPAARAQPPPWLRTRVIQRVASRSRAKRAAGAPSTIVPRLPGATARPRILRSPPLRFCTHVGQGDEAVRVEHFDAVGSVESLDVGVLRGTPCRSWQGAYHRHTPRR